VKIEFIQKGKVYETWIGSWGSIRHRLYNHYSTAMYEEFKVDGESFSGITYYPRSETTKKFFLEMLRKHNQS